MKKMYSKIGIITLIFMLIGVFLCGEFAYSDSYRELSLRSPLLFGKRSPRSGAIAKLDSIRIIEIKDIEDGRVRIQALIAPLGKKKELPLTLYGRRAEDIINERLLEMRTGNEEFDKAFLEALDLIPKDNIFILEENFERIRGFGQYDESGICAVGLVESLIDETLALWHEVMHVAYEAGKLDIVDIHRFVKAHPNSANVGNFFYEKIKGIGHGDNSLLHYALITMQMCCWPEENRKLHLKINQPVSVPRDEDDYCKKVQHRLALQGGARFMWEIFLGSVFGHGRTDVQIEIINRCPVGCEHCLAWHKMMLLPKKNMEVEKVKDIIRNMAGAEKICFTGGEPFLYYNTVKKMCNGEASEEFMEIVRFASQFITEVVIDTCGLVIPSDTDEARVFFAQFPDNVTFEISLDDEHEEGLRKFGKELKDIVKVSELARESGRAVKYNVRCRRGESFEETLKGWDYEGKVLEQYRIEQHKSTKISWDEGIIRLSRIKFQSNAVTAFDPDMTKWDHSYALMEIDKFVENIFPRHTFLFVSHNGDVFFDAHSGFMHKPPEISRLGNITQKSIAEVMLDGILGRLVGFDRHPYLRDLYLSRFFHMRQDQEMSHRCLEKARLEGSDYESRYGKLTNGATFASIVSGNRSSMEFLRHVYIASIDNLILPEGAAWLKKVLPHDVACVWRCGTSIEEDEAYYISSVIQEKNMRRKLIRACIRDFVMSSSRRKESIIASIDAIITVINKGGYIIRSEHTMALKTSIEGVFAFVPFYNSLDRVKIFDDEKLSSYIVPESTIKAFNEYTLLMQVYWGDFAKDFFRELEQRLEGYLRETGHVDRKQKWLVDQYLNICRKRPSQEMPTEELDIASWFIRYFMAKLEVRRWGDTYWPHSNLVNQLREGALTPRVAVRASQSIEKAARSRAGDDV